MKGMEERNKANFPAKEKSVFSGTGQCEEKYIKVTKKNHKSDKVKKMTKMKQFHKTCYCHCFYY